MAPKKKNAFFLFCEEYRREHSKDGYNMSLKQAMENGAQLWDKLSELEKEKYRNKAKQTSSPTKYTSFGIPIDYVEKVEEEKKAYERNMMKKIAMTVEKMVGTNSLQYMDVCIFHVNTFCYVLNEKRHYPAEVAVSKFNLRDGVYDVYHALCNPGPLPLGYAATVQKKSNESHQLLPPAAGASNLQAVFYDLVSFVNDRRSRGKPPPLYVPPKNCEVAREFLSSLCISFGYDPSFLEVYSLSHLFYHMRNGAAEKIVFPSVTLALIEFERDVYEYTTNISCSVHEALGAQNQCSKSFVTRMAYIICDHCCQDMNIELIPGQHVAINAKVVSSKASSVVSDSVIDENKPNKKFYSDELRFSDEDGASSVLRVRSKMSKMRLNFNEGEADLSSSSLKPLDFKSCCYDDFNDKYFSPTNCSQESSISTINSLSQKTVCDYSSSDDLFALFTDVTYKKNKGRGKGCQMTGKK